MFLFRKIYHEDKVNQHQLFVLHWIYWPWIGSIRYFGGSFGPLGVHFYKPLACQDLDRMRNNDIFSKCGSQMEPSNFLHKWKLRWEASINVTQTTLHLCSISICLRGRRALLDFFYSETQMQNQEIFRNQYLFLATVVLFSVSFICWLQPNMLKIWEILLISSTFK